VDLDEGPSGFHRGVDAVRTGGDESGYNGDDAEACEKRGRGGLDSDGIRGSISISDNRWSVFVDLDSTLRFEGTSDGDVYATSDAENVGVVKGVVHGVHKSFSNARVDVHSSLGEGVWARVNWEDEVGEGRGRATLKGGGVTRTNWAGGSGFVRRRRQMFWKKPIVENTSTVCWLLRRLGD